MKTLYPEITPFCHFFLQTESEHHVYVEQSGNAQGIPVVFLHGGPCSGTKPDHRRFFNPEKYHIILLDQRGCGQSKPFGLLANNTTQDLIADMEAIRKKLQISQWLLLGGSWGGTLALLYAQQYPQHVLGMVIRGVFLARQQDMDWFVKKNGVGLIYHEKWQQLIKSVPHSDDDSLIRCFYDVLLQGNDAELAQRRIAKAWMEWGGQIALQHDYQAINRHITEQMVQQVAMEIHYARHRYFIVENQILENCEVLQTIPTIIIHGRNDLVCPLEAGYSLQRKLPHAEFIILPDAGHVAKGESMVHALVDATDRMLGLMGDKQDG